MQADFLRSFWFFLSVSAYILKIINILSIDFYILLKLKIF